MMAAWLSRRLRFCGSSLDLPGSWRACAGWPWAVGRGNPGLGWSGRLDGRSGGSFEQVHPFLFAMPFSGQVQGDVAAAAAGGAAGDVDEVAAQRGAAVLGAGKAGQGTGGAQQVVADGGAG